MAGYVVRAGEQAKRVAKGWTYELCRNVETFVRGRQAEDDRGGAAEQGDEP